MVENEENPNKLVRLLIVDDQRLLREGIASLLNLQNGIEVVGTAGSGLEALTKAQLLQPDVILMDVRMPGMNGVEATARLKRELAGCKILMLTTFDDDEYIIEALQAGASGYLLKNIPEDALARAVIAVHNGIYQLDTAVAHKLITALASNSKTPPTNSSPPTSHASANTSSSSGGGESSGLTERELEVLQLTAQGLSNSEIAGRLSISEGTVKNHISSILARLGVRDRIQAILYARENGLV